MSWAKSVNKLLEDVYDIIYSDSDFDKAAELINGFSQP